MHAFVVFLVMVMFILCSVAAIGIGMTAFTLTPSTISLPTVALLAVFIWGAVSFGQMLYTLAMVR